MDGSVSRECGNYVLFGGGVRMAGAGTLTAGTRMAGAGVLTAGNSVQSKNLCRGNSAEEESGILCLCRQCRFDIMRAMWAYWHQRFSMFREK